MTVVETLSVFIGAPVAVTALVALLVYGPSRARRAQRYRPGIAMEFRPVWFLAARASSQDHVLLEQGARPSGADEVGESIGGARARW